MSSLAERLTQPDVQPQVVDGCCRLIDGEVAGKRGFGGTAVKAGFAVVTRVKPGFVREVVTKLLPDFAAALQPIYDDCVRDTGGAAGDASVADAFVSRLSSDRRAAAEALLGVTDRKIGGARPAVRKAYERLRPNARQNVEGALPGLAKTMRPYL